MGKEDIKKLFERFLDKQRSGEAAEDIRAGDKLFDESRAPEPDEELISGIKEGISRQLSEKRQRRRVVYKAVATAAAVLIIGLFGYFSFFEPAEGPIQHSESVKLTSAVWDSNDIAEGDSEIAYVSNELERISEEIYTIEHGESEMSNEEWLFELENELLAVNGDFWKD